MVRKESQLSSASSGYQSYRSVQSRDKNSYAENEDPEEMRSNTSGSHRYVSHGRESRYEVNDEDRGIKDRYDELADDYSSASEMRRNLNKGDQ